MKRFEIYPVDLNPTIGTEMNKTKPYMNGLKNDSYIVLDQFKTVDKLRLYLNPMGCLTKSEKKNVSDILCQMFAN